MPTRADTGSEQIRRKAAVVDEIKTKLAEADAAVLTEYRGLGVGDLAELRAALRPCATEYKIFKNTLARRAAGGAGLDEILDLLDGPVAIAFVRGDPVGAAKALRDFARVNPNLVVKGGLLGPRVLTRGDVEALAEVPPRDVLLARVAGAFQAPLTKAAGLFQAFTRNFAYGLKAYVDQRIAAGEAPSTEAAEAVEAVEAPSDEALTAAEPVPEAGERGDESTPEPETAEGGETAEPASGD